MTDLVACSIHNTKECELFTDNPNDFDRDGGYWQRWIEEDEDGKEVTLYCCSQCLTPEEEAAARRECGDEVWDSLA